MEPQNSEQQEKKQIVPVQIQPKVSQNVQVQRQKISRSRSPSSSNSSYRSGSESLVHSDAKGQTSGEKGSEKGQFVRYKYCCKVCKHPDKSKKACVCVVPLSQRRTEIGKTGCRNCGCKGCSKQDYVSKGEDPVYRPGLVVKQQRSRPERRVERPRREEEERRSRRRQSPQRRRRHTNSRSRSRSPQIIDSYNMKFFNIDRSVVGNMFINEFQLDPLLVGFGVPQRCHSYIMGRPK